MILQRSFLDALLDSLTLRPGGIVGFVIAFIACLLIFKLRSPIPKPIVLAGSVSAAVIPFVIPDPILQRFILIALLVMVIGELLLFTGASRRLSKSRQAVLDITQLMGFVILLWASLSLVIITLNLVTTWANGTKSVHARLINKLDEAEKERVLLIFSVSQEVSQSGFMDVWLPITNSPGYTEEDCYRVEYFQSPVLKVEGRSDAYVTSIQSQKCDSSIE